MEQGRREKREGDRGGGDMREWIKAGEWPGGGSKGEGRRGKSFSIFGMLLNADLKSLPDAIVHI